MVKRGFSSCFISFFILIRLRLGFQKKNVLKIKKKHFYYNNDGKSKLICRLVGDDPLLNLVRITDVYFEVCENYVITLLS